MVPGPFNLVQVTVQNPLFNARRASMSNEKLPLRLKSGKKIVHGGYSFMRTGDMPPGPGKIEIERYLTYIRESYIGQLTNSVGEAKLTPGQLVLLNKLVTLEGCQRLVEVQAERDGSVSTLDERYNSRNNLIVKICLALGIDPDEHERYVSADEQAELIRADLKDKKEKEANGS